jgi:hypothetical protein
MAGPLALQHRQNAARVYPVYTRAGFFNRDRKLSLILQEICAIDPVTKGYAVERVAGWRGGAAAGEGHEVPPSNRPRAV